MATTNFFSRWAALDMDGLLADLSVSLGGAASYEPIAGLALPTFVAPSAFAWSPPARAAAQSIAQAPEDAEPEADGGGGGGGGEEDPVIVVSPDDGVVGGGPEAEVEITGGGDPVLPNGAPGFHFDGAGRFGPDTSHFATTFDLIESYDFTTPSPWSGDYVFG